MAKAPAGGAREQVEGQEVSGDCGGYYPAGEDDRVAG